MSSRFQNRFRIASLDRGTWLAILFVLMGVLAPTAAVLWFMNEAARSQSEVAEQRVQDAYRSQLRLVQQQVSLPWEARAKQLKAGAERATGADFARLVRGGVVKTVIFLKDNRVVYPSQPVQGASDPLAEDRTWIRATSMESQGDLPGASEAYAAIIKGGGDPNKLARAAQGEVRSWLRRGDPETAVTTVLARFGSGAVVRGTNPEGRLIAPDEFLLVLHLLDHSDRRWRDVLTRLGAMLNDYEAAPMPSTQRLFLMDEARSLAGSAAPAFPTYEAEQLAAKYVASGDNLAPGVGTAGVRTEGVWRLAPQAEVVALYAAADVVREAQAVVDRQNADGQAKFALWKPGEAVAAEAVALGSYFPDWQVGFSIVNPGAGAAAAQQRIASYLWVGYLVAAALAITGLVLLQWIRRQMRLTRLKADLVATASHEFKTPLASMRLLVESLLDNEELDPKKTREYLQLIAGENARLSRLIETFLTFSRIERNRQTFEFAPTDPAGVIEETMAAVRERFGRDGSTLNAEIPGELPKVVADRDALGSALLNLVDNAYKYTGEDKRITVRGRAEAGGVALEVQDNGIGIARRDQKRIFRRFYQVDQRLARETGGCGLGLSIVDYVVRAHGGRVSVTSQPGSGSTFRIWLPAEESEKPA